MDRTLVPTDEGAVHVWSTRGAASTPLLALHMSPRSGRMYHRVMDHLEGPVAAPDRIGSGMSDPMANGWTIEGSARSLIRILDHFGWEQVDVVGTHTGTTEAVALAHQAPSRVRRLMLVALPAYLDEEIETRLSGIAAPRPGPDVDGTHVTAMWHNRISWRRPPYDLDHHQELFIDEVISAPTIHRVYAEVIRYPLIARLRELTTPYVVVSPADDLAAQTTRALPMVDPEAVVELPDLDFDLWHTAPQRMAEIVTTGLRRQPVAKGAGRSAHSG